MPEDETECDILVEGNSLFFTKDHAVFSVQKAYTEISKMHSMIEDIRALGVLIESTI